MSDVSLNTPEIQRSSQAGIGTFLANFRLWVADYLERRKHYRRSVYELSLCSDRDLRDLGISRFDIRRLSREAASMAPPKRG